MDKCSCFPYSTPKQNFCDQIENVIENNKKENALWVGVSLLGSVIFFEISPTVQVALYMYIGSERDKGTCMALCRDLYLT